MIAKIIDKKVILPKFTVVCGDDGAEEITFLCPKTIDGISLVNIPCYIKIENSFGKVCKSLVDVSVSGDYINILWKIGKEVTSVCGMVKCQLCFEKTDGKMVMNTTVFNLEIQAGVNESSDEILLEINHITQLQNKLQQQIEDLNGKIGSGFLTSGSNISLLNNDAKYIKESDANATYALKEDLSSKIATFGFNDVKSFIDSTHNGAFFYHLGDFIHIRNGKFPLLIVNGMLFMPTRYNYVSDEKFLTDVKTHSGIKVGKFIFSMAPCVDFEIPRVDSSQAGKSLYVSSEGKWEVR